MNRHYIVLDEDDLFDAEEAGVCQCDCACCACSAKTGAPCGCDCLAGNWSCGSCLCDRSELMRHDETCRVSWISGPADGVFDYD